MDTRQRTIDRAAAVIEPRLGVAAHELALPLTDDEIEELALRLAKLLYWWWTHNSV